jgi:DNA polymerase III subunit delta
MAVRSYAPTIMDAIASLKNKILPVYYFYGEDEYNINNASRLVEKALQPLVETDFDREIFYGDKLNINEVLNFALSFPFGAGKKFILVKDFEKVKEKKGLTSYINSPAEFTTVVFLHYGPITSMKSEPFLSLQKNGYLFESKELKEESLINWIVEFAASKDKVIKKENARILTSISGENRSNIEAQIEKILLFTGDEREITFDAIKALSTELKEYTIFDLTNALSQKRKDSLKIALSLIEKETASPIAIIGMLTKFFTAIARVKEMTELKMPDAEAAKYAGTHPFYYNKDYKEARTLFSDNDLRNIASALFKADLTLKSSTVDNKSVVTLLIAEIIK